MSMKACVVDVMCVRTLYQDSLSGHNISMKRAPDKHKLSKNALIPGFLSPKKVLKGKQFLQRMVEHYAPIQVMSELDLAHCVGTKIRETNPSQIEHHSQCP